MHIDWLTDWLYSPQNTRNVAQAFKNNRGRLPERHDCLSMLAAFTTKWYNTGTQMHKNHNKRKTQLVYGGLNTLCHGNALQWTIIEQYDGLYKRLAWAVFPFPPTSLPSLYQHGTASWASPAAVIIVRHGIAITITAAKRGSFCSRIVYCVHG